MTCNDMYDLCYNVICSNGCIADIGTDEEVKQRFPDIEADEVIDATGKTIIPGCSLPINYFLSIILIS